jgi:hypothetical protein
MSLEARLRYLRWHRISNKVTIAAWSNVVFTEWTIESGGFCEVARR